MNEHANQHLPSPEFRASLERDVVQAFRRQSQFAAPPSVTRRARFRTAATLVIGLALGAGGVAASAQVQNARVRDSLTSEVDLKRASILLRLEIAQLKFAEIKKAFDVGARSAVDLSAVELELRSAENNVRKINLQLEEIKASGLAPRMDLLAPLVAKRDFVTEYLKSDAAWVTDRLTARERILADARLRASMGAISADDTLDAHWEVFIAERDLLFEAKQLEWRKRYLENQIAKERVSSELQFYELQNRLQITMELMKQKQARAKREKDREAVGVGTPLDVKRAELEVLENATDIERLQKQLKAVQAQLAAQALKKKD